MKIIFLDIDGVLNTTKQREYLQQLNNDKDDWEYNNIFCKKSLANLYEIVKQTGANIVLHTSRRFSDALLIPLRYQFIEYGLNDCFIARTPRLNEGDIHSKDRENEIITWMSNKIIEKFVILDDDINCFNLLKNNLVHVDFVYGISEDNKIQAINILNN